MNIPTTLLAIAFALFALGSSGQVHVSEAPMSSYTRHHHARMSTLGPSSSPETSFHIHHHARKPFHGSKRPTYKSPLKRDHQSGLGGKDTSPAWPLFPSSTDHRSTLPTLAPSPTPVASSDCTALVCTKPFTSTPAGHPCGCVQPIQVKLRLDVALYSFFPLVTELTSDIASNLLLNRSQVRVIGASAASQWLDKTIAVIDLVPPVDNFKYDTAFSTYKKFWRNQIYINSTLFGAYKVLYVHYPGLPPSPQNISPDFAAMDEHGFPVNGNGGGLLKPLGADVPKIHKKRPSGITIAVIVLSIVTAFVVFMAIVWILILKRRSSVTNQEETAPSMSSATKMPGVPRSLTLLSGPQSVPSSSDTLTFTGSAKVFSISEIQRATNRFDPLRVLGEGGFGVVYNGVLDDGEKVAVKLLKRGDRQGAREFLAEVEMLSRLHHRNLVKLIGICREESLRCLVYELVPNGSVESHLHGGDKENVPLDWETRMKIALGAARGLAYLHEDSNPCVIHRDFKSSNILLEHDFTPKVSDFGLARAALDQGNQCISTRVMGTFGYLAPEYAMTGHLLVKSDVYSYGVVLLELLTGRKPVDLTQPQGQENLVAWARPLLRNKDAVETIIDPGLNSTLPLDSLSKVAAIASMCVSPEVSRRPFMGEVVQALKLVCSEVEDCKKEAEEERRSSRAFSDLLVGVMDLDSKGSDDDGEGFSRIELTVFEEHSFCVGRPFRSGPLGSGEKTRFWERFKTGSMSEHDFPYTT